LTLSARFPSPLRRALPLALLASVVALLASSSKLHGFLLDILSTAERIVLDRPVLGVVAFIALAAASAMLAFLSSAVIAPVGILAWGKAVSVVLLWMGWVLGGVITYSIGRYLGRPVVKRLSRGPHLERYEHAVSGEHSFLFALLFQFALPSEVPGYLLGLARFPWRKYLAVLLIAELPYAVATIYLGDSFLHRQTLLLISLAAAVVAVSALALNALHSRLSYPARRESDD
jgi:uncharacterized membrane protein YdjX (TVP38/TMEM64 family)